MRFSEVPSAQRRTEAVRQFYRESPFPGYRPHETLSDLRTRGARSEFARLLDQAIAPGARVLDLGCGTGQMALFLASGSQRTVVAADLTRASLELGARAARRLGVDGVVFVESDLRRPAFAPGSFDVVFSSGVLHHTPDPPAAFAAVVPLVRPGGIIVLGLYNAYARLPHRFRRLIARLSGFRLLPFDPVLRDRRAQPERRRAWLRDQYLHPEEHRHTLSEVQRWFNQNGVEYLRTYPSSLMAEDPVRGDQLFKAAEDNWGFEGWLAQLTWMTTLSHEGGLFVVIGRRLYAEGEGGGPHPSPPHLPR
jgi:SAM-dependent methyltransferase